MTPPIVQQAGGIRLRDLFPQCRLYGDDDPADIHSCCGDAGQCRPGDLFVALPDAERDGHELALQAVDRGACCVLAERPLPLTVPVAVVEDTREAYGILCQHLAGNPARQLHTIGVTGTAGKTVTAMLIASVLKSDRRRVGMTGSLGYCDTIEAESAPHATPGAPEMAIWLQRMVAAGCRHAVIEASSLGLAERRLAGIPLDAAVITNVRRDHLDIHRSVDNYRRAKARLLDMLKPTGYAVLNADDPVCNRFLGDLDGPVLTVGIENEAEIMAEPIERWPSEQTFLISAGNETMPVRTTMIGDHHIRNCLSAAAVGLIEGLDLATIVRGLEAVDFVPGRLERIERGRPFNLFLDQSRSSDTLTTALKTLRQVTQGKLYCLFGAEGRRGQADRPLLGRAVERWADYGVITGFRPRGENPLRIAHDILDGYRRPERGHVIPTREEAVRWVLSQAQPDDTVLIACSACGSSDRMEGEELHDCDDRAVVEEWFDDNP